MRQLLKLVLAQINPVVGDLGLNTKKILDVWKNVPPDCELVIFPEMVVCGYPPEDLILKPAFLKAIHAAVDDICERSRDFPGAALIPCPWVIDDQTYNAALIIEGGKITATRAKHNLPNYGVFDEMRLFAPGPLPDIVTVHGHKIGIMVCEDMWYPEVAAHLKTEGADILIVPNGSPYEQGKLETRLNIARERVAETGLPLVYVNQIGGQDDLVFDGASFVLDQNGQALFQGAQFEQGAYKLEVRRDETGQWRIGGDKTMVLMDPEEELYQALMLGLRDYVYKNGFTGVLLGLSGGIDSALAALIAADALGAGSVSCIMMPSQFTSQDSLDDAEAFAKNLGCRYEITEIAAPLQAVEKLLPGLKDLAHENLQSRIRGLMLMARSNATGKMLLSTGNKSEMATGYATLYGDMCGGFNVLKDVYKTQIYTLSKWRNAHRPKNGIAAEGALIPERIITKAPTAELKDNQTDQDTLPPYDVLDAILHGLIEEDLGLEELCAKGYDRDTIATIWAMLDRAEYKRRQSPPGVKVTPRAFGRDRRYPMMNKFLI